MSIADDTGGRGPLTRLDSRLREGPPDGPSGAGRGGAARWARAMKTARPVLFMTGTFLIILGAFMLIPALVNWWVERAEWLQFVESGLITSAVGAVLVKGFELRDFSLMPRQMFLLTVTTWVAVSAFAALPMVVLEHISFTDAFFETMSGITTTGSTIFARVRDLPPGLLIWRSLLQWLGGIGFIVMAVAVLPFLRIGGMRLFRTESSEWSGRVTPRAESTAKGIVLAYVALTVACAAAYRLAGMDLFDAVNHAMTTLSTGGYSTYDHSLAHFSRPAVHWVAVVFMALGSLPFVLYVKAGHGEPQLLFRDRQVRGFFGFVVFAVALMTVWLWASGLYPPGEALRRAAFNVVSVITTTGYVLGDYSLWGSAPLIFFFYLLFVGGCSGSTAGGIKIFRFQLSHIILFNHVGRLLHPRLTRVDKYNGRLVDEEVVLSIVGFSFFYTVTVAALSFALALLGLDFVSALSGAATAVGNVGPGLGSVIGPAGNFSTLPDLGKWLLSLGMLMGRLEIITVLVLLTPAFWRA